MVKNRMRNLRTRLLLAVFSVASVALFLACQPSGVEYVKYDSEAAVPRISAVEAKKDFDAGNAVFVDSRGDPAFLAEHLPGALSIPDDASEDRFSQLPKGKKIIIYCS